MKKKILSSLLCAAVTASTIVGCGQSAATSTSTTDSAKTEASKTEAVAETKAEEQTADSGEKVTLSVYTQYADDDTKVPYDYAVE